MGEYINRTLAKAQFTSDFREQYPVSLIKALIDEVPTANVQEVRHGKWIFRGDYTSMCSCCNNDVDVDHEKEPKYCPECGAKMDGEEQK